MAKYVGKGTKLKMQTASTSLTTIGQIRSISLGDASADDIDVTTLDNATIWRQFRKSWADGGEVSFELVYDPALAAHKQLGTLMGTTATKKVEVVFATTTVSVSSTGAYVKGLSGEIPFDDVITSTVTLKNAGGTLFATT